MLRRPYGEEDIRGNDLGQCGHKPDDIVVFTVMGLVHFTAVSGKYALHQKNMGGVAVDDRGGLRHMIFDRSPRGGLGLEGLSVPVIYETQYDLFVRCRKGGENGVELIESVSADRFVRVTAKVNFQQHDGLRVVRQHILAPLGGIVDRLFGKRVSV